MSASPPTALAISVIILNYNGSQWLPRCLASLRGQTIFGQTEVILADNHSTDDSVAVAKEALVGFPAARILENQENLGFCEGNNAAARTARGRFLFFLNPDTWLEPNCLEVLLAETQRAVAAGATPWVLNYADGTHQDLGFFGLDLFGLASPSSPASATRPVFAASGCAYFIDAEVFKKVGMFDREFFMYSDEVDLSWRVWIAGHQLVGVPGARLHHRGAANVNPSGGPAVIEYRTTDRKRFFTNRNGLLTLLKNGQHFLALAVVPLTVLLFLETLVGCLVLRRPSFFNTTFTAALRDCWRLRGHVRQQRRLIASFRRRSDFWMLRFLRWRLNRWFEIKRLFQFGLPRVDAR